MLPVKSAGKRSPAVNAGNCVTDDVASADSTVPVASAIKCLASSKHKEKRGEIIP